MIEIRPKYCLELPINILESPLNDSNIYLGRNLSDNGRTVYFGHIWKTLPEMAQIEAEMAEICPKTG